MSGFAFGASRSQALRRHKNARKRARHHTLPAARGGGGVMMQTETTTHQQSVAILEDEAIFQELLASLVENAGMSIQHRSSSARDFLLSVASSPPQVAIVDLKLEDAVGRPTGDGLQVLAELSARLPSVKTVVLSATHDPASVSKCFDLGASAFVYKHQARCSDIIAAVQGASRGERMFPARTMEFSAAPSTPKEEERSGALAGVTPKEHAVLRFVSGGVDNAVIAAHLNITERTVKAHLASLYRKLKCANRTQLALRARELSVLPFV
jgi:two-component system, NarL family, nitrate/nitrite response regulator NarL